MLRSPPKSQTQVFFSNMKSGTRHWHLHCGKLFEDPYTPTEKQGTGNKVYDPGRLDAMQKSQEEMETNSASITCMRNRSQDVPKSGIALVGSVDKPTVKVGCITNRVSSSQTGYSRKYHPPPPQVLISQALLGGLA